MNDRSVVLLDESMLEQYVDYLHAHMSESGINGNLVYTPFPLKYEHPKEMMLKNIGDNIKKPFEATRWERTFICMDGVDIVAHAALKGHYLDAALHRCEVGLGMNQAVRAQGLGKRMMEHSIEWLKTNSPIEYIDLYVFSHNHAAIKLYTKLGFSHVGVNKDMFRINGLSIDDNRMTLKLR